MESGRKIKVLHVIESLACGGAERMLITTLAHLDREKFHNVVIYLYKDSYFLPEIEAIGVDAYSANLKNVYHPLAALRSIYGVIKKEKIDIVHTNLFGADIYGRISAKLANVKSVITTIHNLAYNSPENFRSGFFFKRRKILDALTGRLCNKSFIAVSNAVKKSAEESLGFKNIKLIYNSVDLKKFSPLLPGEKKSARESLGLKENTVVIVTTGRLDPQKGHAFLLEALNAPGIKNENVALLLLGCGVLEDNLKDIIKTRGLEDKVIFLGRKKEVRQIVGCADIFVLPTISEGFGLSLLEAMALKVPCVASRTGGINEIIEDGRDGLLAEPGCADSIAQALVKLIGDPGKRRGIALSGYDKVVNNFDIEKNVKMLEKTYEDG